MSGSIRSLQCWLWRNVARLGVVSPSKWASLTSGSMSFRLFFQEPTLFFSSLLFSSTKLTYLSSLLLLHNRRHDSIPTRQARSRRLHRIPWPANPAHQRRRRVADLPAHHGVCTLAFPLLLSRDFALLRCRCVFSTRFVSRSGDVVLNRNAHFDMRFDFCCRPIFTAKSINDHVRPTVARVSPAFVFVALENEWRS